MSKYLMKRIILLLALSYNPAHADQWIRYATDLQHTLYEYNHTRITHHDLSGKTFVVWSRTQDSTTRYELHCGSQSYRKTYEITRQLQEVVWQSDDNTPRWQYAAPEGVELVLIDRICHDYE